MHFSRRLISLAVGLLLVVGLVIAVPSMAFADGGSKADAKNVVLADGSYADGSAVAVAENNSLAKAWNFVSAKSGSCADGDAIAKAENKSVAIAKSFSKAENCSVADSFARAEASCGSLALAKSDVEAECGSKATGTAIADATPGPCDQGTAISISSDFNKDALAIGYSFNITSGGKAISKSFVFSSAEDGACSDALAYSSSSGSKVAGDIAFGDGTSSAVTYANVSK